MTRAASALALVVVAAACSGGGATFDKDDLSSLVLREGDVARPFVVFDEGRQVRADAFPGAQQDPQRFGREDGWKARFRRQGTPSTRGPLVIESRADLFEGDGGAKRDFAAYRTRFESAVAEGGGTADLVEVPPLGDEAAAITFRQLGGTTEIRFFTIAWRHDNVTASVTVNGFNGRLFFADALRLAQKQAQRIERAAR